MNNLPVVQQLFNGQSIQIRESDGYWNATLMCQIYGKQINDFLRLKSTNAYLEELSAITGIPVMYQGDTLRGSSTDCLVLVSQKGSWVYPDVALKLAAWLNPGFEVWVFSVIKKLLTQGRVELEAELNCYREIIEAAFYDLDELRREVPWHRQNQFGAAMDDIDPYD